MDIRGILIVEDEPTAAFSLGRMLEHLNESYRVNIAHSGEEALDALNNQPVDLLVTDLRMPGISGLELIRRVRASSPQTQAILITAYGSAEVETEAHRLGVCRYISKPFLVEDLLNAVQEVLKANAEGEQPERG